MTPHLKQNSAGLGEIEKITGEELAMAMCGGPSHPGQLLSCSSCLLLHIHPDFCAGQLGES